MGRPWFGARQYGIGWSPKTWEGWISSALFCGLFVANSVLGRVYGAPYWVTELVGGAILFGFIALVALKNDGKPVKWQWGGR